MSYLIAGSILGFLTAFCFVMVPLVKKIDSKEYTRRLYDATYVIHKESLSQKVKSRLVGFMGKEYVERIRLLLLQSDMENTNPETIVFLSGILGISLAAMFFLLLLGYGSVAFLGLILGGFVGVKLPEAYLRQKSDKRKNTINASILTYTELLATACNAGLNAENAIERIAENTKSILSEEIKRTWKESNTRKTRDQAIKDMIKRCGTNEVRLFMEAVNIGMEMGTPMAALLKEQAKSIRSRDEARVIKKGDQAKVKIVFTMFLFLLPSVLTVTFVPPMLQFMKAMQGF